MNRRLVPTSALAPLLLLALAATPALASNVDLPRFPAISPDGSTIVFSWRGDLWKVPSRGGEAIRLTAHPGDDLGSAWSPDGSRIAFESDRDGYTNLYLMSPDGTDVRQVTAFDARMSLVGFGTDDGGKPVLSFSAALEPELYRAPRPYRVPLEGGPAERMLGAFGSEAATSPDGRKVLFTRGDSSWNRRHYLGPDNRDVWVFDRSDGSYRRLTTWTGNDGKARWLGNDTVLFLSDRDGQTVNVFTMPLATGEVDARPLTAFRGQDVVDYDVSADGGSLVVQVWDAMHLLDLRDPSAQPVRLAVTASEDEGDRVELRDAGRSVSEAQLSPDGKTLAVVAFGDVYVRAVEDKSPTVPVTRTEARERDISWSPDGLQLYFVSDEDGTESIYVAEVEQTRKELRDAARKATKGPEPAAPATPLEPAIPPEPPAFAQS